MTSPDSPEDRRYLNRIDKAIWTVVVVAVVCGIGYGLCDSYVRENTYASGHYYGPTICIWGTCVCEIGILACLLTGVGFLGEARLRGWYDRRLKWWELMAAVPCGLLACVAVCLSLYVTFVVIECGIILCGNFAFDSLVGVLAIGIAMCLISSIGLAVYAWIRHRQSRSTVTNVMPAVVLLALVGAVTLAVFIPMRAAEGRKQREIVAALQAKTHRVHYSYGIESDGHTCCTKRLPCSWVSDWLVSLAGIDFFHRVVRVDLESTDPNVDDVLPYLRGLSSLKYVVLSTEVPAAKIRQIEQALPSCEIKYIHSYEESPWPPPPVH